MEAKECLQVLSLFSSFDAHSPIYSDFDVATVRAVKAPGHRVAVRAKRDSVEDVGTSSRG
jgi:hypothetical protein